MVAALAVTMTLSTGPVVAHDEQHESSKSSAPPNCTKAEQKRLNKAQDNFAEACEPGENLAAMDDSAANLAAGDWAAVGMQLLKNIPKQGPFAPQTAFNSDLAFKGKYAYAGNYEGFMIYDLSNPRTRSRSPRCSAQARRTTCPCTATCSCSPPTRAARTTAAPAWPSRRRMKSSWEGLKVFDISDPTNPRYIAAVETACGSHTHTLAPSKSGKDLYVYVSSYFPDCDVPRLPAAARPDQRREDLRWRTRQPQRSSAPRCSSPAAATRPGNDSRETSGCHDITAYPEKNIAAGACMGDGILMDISDREHPVVTETRQGHHELRVLALGDLQQRRHQGGLHRRARRRRRGHLQPDDRHGRRAPTASTTSGVVSSASRATTRSRGSTPTPRTAWRTTAR